MALISAVKTMAIRPNPVSEQRKIALNIANIPSRVLFSKQDLKNL